MLNEAPKKPKKNVDYAHPTKWQLFYRTQRECWRRMVTPYLMYFFMSLLMLACQTFSAEWARIGTGLLCIAGGAFFNGHLCYNYGIDHYGNYVAGSILRRNEANGIVTGSGHRPEREYSPWKGFYIGFLVGVPVIVFGVLAGALYGTGDSVTGNYAALALIMFAGWAIVPVTWINNLAGTGLSLYCSIAMIVLPILISGLFYVLGANVERKKRAAEAEREARILEAGKQAKERHEQTEEQRKKTLQSKKKK